jgi:hypothetical protein
MENDEEESSLSEDKYSKSNNDIISAYISATNNMILKLQMEQQSIHTRLKERLTESSCPICMKNIEDEIMIYWCCYNVTCVNCHKMGGRLRHRVAYACPFCASYKHKYDAFARVKYIKM